MPSTIPALCPKKEEEVAEKNSTFLLVPKTKIEELAAPLSNVLHDSCG
jgi:hypothetical protein